MYIPEDLIYTESHEWIKQLEDDTVLIGLTDYAQENLGSIVYVGLPEVEQGLLSGESFSDVESVKAVSDVYSPVDGIVSEINASLLDSPELINESPYDSWFIKAKNVTVSMKVMTAAEYADYLETL